MTYPQNQSYPQETAGASYAAAPMRTSGMSVAGMVLGIITLVGFWIPIGSVILGVLAVALSGAGIAQTGKPGYTGRGMAITGLVCGIVGLIPSVIFMVAFIGAASSV